MVIKTLTIFPQMFEALNYSVVGRAVRAGLFSLETIDIRSFSTDKHRKTDDYPFGGGSGMVMMAQPIIDAMTHATLPPFTGPRISLSPRGEKLNQRVVERLASLPGFILLCGHYEGVDQRALDLCIDEELSVGDYILTGGEPAAIVIIDAVARLIPGVLGNASSSSEESFSADGLLEYPQYTHPREVAGLAVPNILLNGDHAKIAAWRREQALRITWERRRDMLDCTRLTNKELQVISEWDNYRG